jgi:hypothetical protein
VGRYRAALAAYAAAERLAPKERDVAVGRARLHAQAGHTEAAIRAYERWLVANAADAEAWRELGRERLRAGRPRAAVRALERSVSLLPHGVTSRRLAAARAESAPMVEPVAIWSRDSDRNAGLGFGAAADILAGEAARLGVSARRTALEDGLNTASVADLAVRTRVRPRAPVTFDVSLGVQRLESSVGAEPPVSRPMFAARVAVRAPGTGARGEARLEGGALAASPELLANRVRRTEGALKLDVPLGGLRLRGAGRAAALDAGVERNVRTLLSGGVAAPVREGVELIGMYHRLRYSDSTSAGYFAPRLSEGLEAGSYAEISAGNWLVALDLAAGAQRAALRRQVMGDWTPSFRFWALAQVTLAPGRDLRFEVEAYDTQLAPVAATTSSWRYLSGTIGLRWAVR